jgi:hypothetical protein
MNSDNVMQIIHRDGTLTLVNDPFGPLKALHENPDLEPDLSEESKQFINEEKAREAMLVKTTRDIDNAVLTGSPEEKKEPEVLATFIGNRHQHRKAAVLARHNNKNRR